jgi:hypothetical protein
LRGRAAKLFIVIFTAAPFQETYPHHEAPEDHEGFEIFSNKMFSNFVIFATFVVNVPVSSRLRLYRAAELLLPMPKQLCRVRLRTI